MVCICFLIGNSMTMTMSASYGETPALKAPAVRSRCSNFTTHRLVVQTAGKRSTDGHVCLMLSALLVQSCAGAAQQQGTNMTTWPRPEFRGRPTQISY